MAVNYQKVWRTMNDLEMVTSKICSAREIIDAAVDRIQEHQHDKAEAMMSAAYEFLEYYLQEFDDKFKLAWQATVGDLRDGDGDAGPALPASGHPWGQDAADVHAQGWDDGDGALLLEEFLAFC